MVSQLLWRALGHQQTTAITAFGSQINQPITGANHIQVVFDDDQRMPCVQQSPQGTHEFGDVIEMQTRGRLIEQKQHAFASERLTTGGGRFGCVSQKARQLESLRFAAAERGHRLAQAHVFKAHIDDGLQSPNHLTVLGKHQHRLAHRQVQHIGHVEKSKRFTGRGSALELDLQNVRSVPLTIAIRTAQVHIAEELHFDMLKPRSATGRAAPIAAVETEFGRGVTALTRQGGVGKQLTNRIPSAHVTHRVGACGFANR